MRRASADGISDTCKKYVEDTERGHDMGYQKLYEFRATYLKHVAKRLDKVNPGFKFTGSPHSQAPI